MVKVQDALIGYGLAAAGFVTGLIIVCQFLKPCRQGDIVLRLTTQSPAAGTIILRRADDAQEVSRRQFNQSEATTDYRFHAIPWGGYSIAIERSGMLTEFIPVDHRSAETLVEATLGLLTTQPPPSTQTMPPPQQFIFIPGLGMLALPTVPIPEAIRTFFPLTIPDLSQLSKKGSFLSLPGITIGGQQSMHKPGCPEAIGGACQMTGHWAANGACPEHTVCTLCKQIHA